MKLLLVEDNAPLAENLAEIFAAEGHQVEVTPNGTRALEAAASGFDLALLDVRLPDMLGTSLLPRLKALVPEAEVIVTTGNADLNSAIEAVRGGAFAYLTKPVAIDDLLLSASRALERVHLRRLSRDLQRAMEESERQHREILENVQALIFAVDGDFKVRFINRAVEDATGWTRAEVLGRNYFQVYVTLSPGEKSLAARALESGTGEGEVDLHCKNGTVRRVHMRWTARSGSELLYGTGLDVTRQREAESKARMAEKLAAVGTLAAGLAHEIRNPLNAAGLQLSLLGRRVGKLSDEERRGLEGPVKLVREELERLDGLLGDFLAFARPREYGRFPMDLSALALRVAALEREPARAAGISLDTDVRADVEVAGEPDALQQVVLNLLRNAREAARSRVSMQLVCANGWAKLVITDDGPGLAPDVAARIFEPFVTTKPTGTGLGLAIVHAIMTGHGGEISVQSAPEGGAVATVKLPWRAP